jgi:hypothetical protein
MDITDIDTISGEELTTVSTLCKFRISKKFWEKFGAGSVDL